MPRSLRLAVPPESTEALQARLLEHEGVLSLRLTTGTSIRPPGDVIELEVLDRDLPSVMQVLVNFGVGTEDGTALTIDSPLATVSRTSTGPALADTNESSLEEMEQIMSRAAAPTASVLALMALSGFLAVVGIAEGALHLVIGAMVIAPGFVPIVRAVFGGIARRGDVVRGVLDTAQTYAALLVGATAAGLILIIIGHQPTGTEPSYQPPLVAVSYWTTITLESALVTLAAGVAGALLIATNRSVLTAGVMIALSLVPAAALVPSALLSADVPLAFAAAARWLVDVALLSVAAAGVLVTKQRFVHRGRTLA
jgi:hypothetical protein